MAIQTTERCTPNLGVMIIYLLFLCPQITGCVESVPIGWGSYCDKKSPCNDGLICVFNGVYSEHDNTCQIPCDFEEENQCEYAAPEHYSFFGCEKSNYPGFYEYCMLLEPK